MLTETADGFRLAVHATPGASRMFVGGSHDNALKVSVHAAADKGKANKAIALFLAKALSLPKSAVKLTKGQQSRIKTFEMPDSAVLPE